MEIPSHSGSKKHSAISLDYSILRPLRALVVALLCMSGGCATMSSVSQNPVARPAAGAQKTDKQSGPVNKPAPKPANKAPQKQDNPQSKDKADRPAPSHYEGPDDEDVPCNEIDLGDPGACELVSNDPEADELGSKLS